MAARVWLPWLRFAKDHAMTALHTWRLLLLAFPLLAICASAADNASIDKERVYVGTYTNKGKSKGIYLFELDTASGKLSAKGVAGEAVDPSFVAIHPNQRYL